MTTYKNDAVNHPSHYTFGEIECIDAIKASMTREQFIGFLKGQVEKYVWRCGHKDAEIQELGKAKWYLERWIEEVSEGK